MQSMAVYSLNSQLSKSMSKTVMNFNSFSTRCAPKTLHFDSDYSAGDSHFHRKIKAMRMRCAQVCDLNARSISCSISLVA